MATTNEERTNDQNPTTGGLNGQDGGGQDVGGVQGANPITATTDANPLPGTSQSTQSNAPHHQNYQNYGYNGGQNGNMQNFQHQQQFQPPPPVQQHQFPAQQQYFQPPQAQPAQQQFQPSPAQPLSYPNYGGYYGQQQYNPYFQNYMGYMPQQNTAPPPQPQPQQPAFTQPPPPPPPPQAAAIQAATDPSVYEESNGDNGTEQGEEEEFSGQLSDKLDEWMAQMQQHATQGPKVCTKLAKFMTYQLEQGFCTADLDFSIKEYPPLHNVPLAWAPELEQDIFSHTRFQNNKPVVATEVALKSIQRGIASSLNALGPLTEIIMRQSENNPELDNASTVILDIIKLLSNSLGGITKKRRDLLKPAIDSKYHQRLGKKDEDFNATFLFGGSVSDRVRKFEAADSLMKEVMKSDPKSNTGQRKNHSSSTSNSGGHSQTNRSSHRAQPYNKPSGSGSSRSNNSQKPRQDFRKGGPHNNNNNNSNNGSRNQRS